LSGQHFTVPTGSNEVAIGGGSFSVCVVCSVLNQYRKAEGSFWWCAELWY